MIRPLVLALALLMHLPAMAVPKDSAMENDCRQLAARDQLPANEVEAYVGWCKKFSKSCYELEDSAAEACGTLGAPEKNISEKSAAAELAMKGREGSYQVDGGAFAANCKSASADRTYQSKECGKASTVCELMQEKFASSKLPKKPTLSCHTFSPENQLWSLNSVKSNICKTIQAELKRVDHFAASEAALCSGNGAIVKDASAETSDQSIKLQNEDKRACGLLGCTKNPDGTYSPNRFSASEPSQTQDSNSSAEANTEIRLNTPDKRGCGLWGCQQNLDGTFSPKYAP